jgi:hypothetical protein
VHKLNVVISKPLYHNGLWLLANISNLWPQNSVGWKVQAAF